MIGHAGRRDRRRGAHPEQLAAGVQDADRVLLAIDVDDRHRGGERMRLRAVRGREQEDPLVGMVHPPELHVLTLSHKRGECEAVAQRLAERGEVRLDAVRLLGAPD